MSKYYITSLAFSKTSVDVFGASKEKDGREIENISKWIIKTQLLYFNINNFEYKVAEQWRRAGGR